MVIVSCVCWSKWACPFASTYTRQHPHPAPFQKGFHYALTW